MTQTKQDKYKKDLIRATQEFIDLLDIIIDKTTEVEEGLQFLEPRSISTTQSQALNNLKGILQGLANTLVSDENSARNGIVVARQNILNVYDNFDCSYVLGNSVITPLAENLQDVDLKTKTHTGLQRINVAIVYVIRGFLGLLDQCQKQFTGVLMNDKGETPAARETRAFFNLTDHPQFFPRPILTIKAAHEEFTKASTNLQNVLKDEGNAPHMDLN